MRRIGSWLVLLALTLGPARAQVTVETLQDQDQFLPGESLQLAVRIVNRSGQKLRLGDEEGWLRFWVESADGLMVPKTAEVPVRGGFVLESAERATKRVDLLPYYSLSRVGRYTVAATVRIAQWDREITSKPRSFFIIDGAKLWEQEVGVPNTSGSNGPPEVRKYMLQQANYIKGQLRLYLRLTDAAGRAIRVFAIGTMVSFSRPEPHVDRLSNLHVLYQNGPRSYSYTVMNPSGEIIVRQTYDYVGSRPRLREEAGDLSVVGGVRRITAADVPAPKKPAAAEETPTLPKEADAAKAGP